MHVGRHVVVARRCAGEQQMRGGGVWDHRGKRIEDLRNALIRRQPAKDAKHHRLGVRCSAALARARGRLVIRSGVSPARDQAGWS